MKIRLNTKFKDYEELVALLSEELPEVSIKAKERQKWGLNKPCFKYKGKLYEFENIKNLMEQMKKILKMTDTGNKVSEKSMESQPVESGEVPKKKEEVVLEIPVEKYNLNDLNIKFRLGAHKEKGSTYEVDQQTLHYEKEEEAKEEVTIDQNGNIHLHTGDNDIILDLPSEKYNLNDLKLKIKFRAYNEADSSYEARKSEPKTEVKVATKPDKDVTNDETKPDKAVTKVATKPVKAVTKVATKPVKGVAKVETKPVKDVTKVKTKTVRDALKATETPQKKKNTKENKEEK